LKFFKTLKYDNSFNEQIFLDCVNNVKCDYYYPLVMENEDSVNNFKTITNNISKQIVVIGTFDIFNMYDSMDQQYILNKPTKIEELIIDVVNMHSDKTFIVFHENINASALFLYNIKNVKLVHWSALTTEKKSYTSLNIFEKNFSSNKTTIALNRQQRQHRCVLISLLYGYKLNKDMQISSVFLNNIKGDLLSDVDWDFSILSDNDIFTLTNGFKKAVCENVGAIDNYTYNNVDNFVLYLKNVYKNSFVEIISNTIFDIPFGVVDEKFLNSVYARNFPIIIGVEGTVDYLRNLGFDVFDDVVNHSYDTIKNPLQRLLSAIFDNKHLYKNNIKVKWKDNEQRFNENINFAKKNMYNVYNTRIKTSFMEAIT